MNENKGTKTLPARAAKSIPGGIRAGKMKRPLKFPNDWWLCLFVLIMGGQALIACLLYPQLPDPLPVHYDKFGEPDRFVPKNIWDGQWFYIVITVVLALAFIGCFLSSKYGKSIFERSAFHLSPIESRILACRILLVAGTIVTFTCTVITYLPLESSRALLGQLIPALCVFLALAVATVIMRTTWQVRQIHADDKSIKEEQ